MRKGPYTFFYHVEKVGKTNVLQRMLGWELVELEGIKKNLGNCCNVT